MNTFPRPTTLALTLVVATSTLFAPSVARANDGDGAIPTYATKDDANAIKGTISSIDGKYDIRVRDAKGYIDRIRLHDGTIINPTGLRLAIGQDVTILGTNSGDRYDANEIDTPYHVDDDYAYGSIGYFGAPAIGYPYYGGFGPYGVGGFGPYGYPYGGVGFGVGFYGGGYYGGGPYGYRGRGWHDHDGYDGRGPVGGGTRVGRPAFRGTPPSVGAGQQTRVIESRPSGFGGGGSHGGGGRR